jgi:hypothetical protein
VRTDRFRSQNEKYSSENFWTATFKRMKRIVIFILLIMASQSLLRAQGAIRFSITFDGVSSGYPFGTAHLSGNSLDSVLYLGTTPTSPRDCQVLDNTLTPILLFKTPLGSLDPSTGEITYMVAGWWSLTDSQVQDVMAGQWYAKAQIGGNTYLGQITPVLVPLHIQLSENTVILTWTDSAYTLQGAPTATGTYTNISGAASPYTNTISGPARYFRLIAN